jgi:hypothetical protein
MRTASDQRNQNRRPQFKSGLRLTIMGINNKYTPKERELLRKLVIAR